MHCCMQTKEWDRALNFNSSLSLMDTKTIYITLTSAIFWVDTLFVGSSLHGWWQPMRSLPTEIWHNTHTLDDSRSHSEGLWPTVALCQTLRARHIYMWHNNLSNTVCILKDSSWYMSQARWRRRTSCWEDTSPIHFSALHPVQYGPIPIIMHQILCGLCLPLHRVLSSSCFTVTVWLCPLHLSTTVPVVTPAWSASCGSVHRFRVGGQALLHHLQLCFNGSNLAGSAAKNEMWQVERLGVASVNTECGTEVYSQWLQTGTLLFLTVAGFQNFTVCCVASIPIPKMLSVCHLYLQQTPGCGNKLTPYFVKAVPE